MEEKVICSSSNKGSKTKLIIAVCFLAIAAVLFLMYYPKYSAALDDISLYWRAYDSNEDLYKMGSELAISPIECKFRVIKSTCTEFPVHLHG
ncbi:hypothetical protein [Pseudoflavonifractor sp. HCP28S3_F10]|uniref:hypothetical protein n=1 Tax=Pseudoflavonifractor sp. HCP28S3_F10 TaxID=3438947 RepID=UPI003F8A8AD3